MKQDLHPVAGNWFLSPFAPIESAHSAYFAPAFRALYPEGRNYVVSPSAGQRYSTREGNLTVTVCDTPDLADAMGLPRRGAPSKYERKRVAALINQRGASGAGLNILQAG